VRAAVRPRARVPEVHDRRAGPVPGRLRFRAVSAAEPGPPAGRRAPAGGTVPRRLPTRAGPAGAGHRRPDRSRGRGRTQTAGRTRRSGLEVVVDRLAGRGRPAHQVWLPPLAEPPTLDQLLGPIWADPRRGLQAMKWPGGVLTVPVGIVDRPLDQRREPLIVDL